MHEIIQITEKHASLLAWLRSTRSPRSLICSCLRDGRYLQTFHPRFSIKGFLFVEARVNNIANAIDCKTGFSCREKRWVKV
jgi:hypothetical protein